LWFVHYPMMRSLEAIDCEYSVRLEPCWLWLSHEFVSTSTLYLAGCTGTNKYGYIMHLTAPKLLGYGYITPNQIDNICSLAIVRNPYTRMVSIYGYNRFGMWLVSLFAFG
jgi:hypothetical protein